MAKKVTKKNIAQQPKSIKWTKAGYAQVVQSRIVRTWILPIVVSVMLLLCLIVWFEWQNSHSNILNFESSNSSETNSTSPQNNINSIPSARPTILSEAGVTLASDFPIDVPIYEGRIAESERSEVAHRKSWIVWIETTHKLPAVIKKIKYDFEQRNWLAESELTDEQSTTFAASNAEMSVVVYAMATPFGARINYTISENE